ncbi:cytochrome c oxidase subunit 1 [Geranomyces variabilis]|nr:cytochrome c oxidase subunit 1 [Geranomyces variabilis]
MSLRVLAAHVPSDDTELALEVGDVVELDLTPATDNEHWWYGTNRSWGPNNGLQGYFPAECVEVETWTIDTSSVQPGIESEFENASPLTAASWVTAPAGGDSDREDENQVGAEQEDANEEEGVEAWTPLAGGKVIVKLPYEKTKADELDLIVGEMIVVMEAPEGGWWRGMKNLGGKTPQSGWFPAMLVRPCPDEAETASAVTVQPRMGPSSLTKPAAQVPEPEPEADSTNDRRKSWFQKRITTKAPANSKKKTARTRSNSAPPTPVAPNSVSGDLEGMAADTSGLSVVTEGSSDLDTGVFEERISAMASHARARSTPPHPPDGDSSSGGGPSKGLNRLSIFLRGDKDRKSHFSGQSKATLMESTFDISSTSPLLHLDDLLIAPNGNDRWQERISAATLVAMSHRAQQRMTAIFEFIKTERDYVRDLKIIIALFMRPMVDKKVVSAKNIDILFSNIEELLTVNSEFLARLEELYAANPIIEQFGDLLVTAMDRFVSYTPYCSRQSESGVKHLSMMQSKREYRMFLEEAYRHPLARRLDLGGFLIKPVQRICKYPLLIREIIKYTDDASPDYEVLRVASERVQSIIGIVNAGTKQAEGAATRKMADVQSDFADKTIIVSASRHLVREDAVFGIFTEGKKVRQLLLFSDALLLAKKDWRDKMHTIALAPFKQCIVADVRENTAAVATTLLELEFLPDASRGVAERYFVSMLSPEVKAAWLDAYRRSAQPFECAAVVKVQTKAGLLTLDCDAVSAAVEHNEPIDETSNAAALTAECAQLRTAAETALTELARERELVCEARAELARQLSEWNIERDQLAVALAGCENALAAAERRAEYVQIEHTVLAKAHEESEQRLEREKRESTELRAALAAQQTSADAAREREKELFAQIEEAVGARTAGEEKLQESQIALVERDTTCAKLQIEIARLQQSAEGTVTELKKFQKLVEDRDQLLAAKSAESMTLTQKLATLERDAAKNRSRADASRAAAETARANAEAALLREQEIGEIRLRAVQQNLENAEKEHDRTIACKNVEIAALTQKFSASEQEASKTRTEALTLAQKLANVDADLIKSRVELAGTSQKLATAEQDLLRVRAESSERLKHAEEAKASIASELDRLRDQRARDQQIYAESERTRRDMQRSLESGRGQFKTLFDTNAQLAVDHAKQKELLAENKLQLKLYAADKEKMDARVLAQEKALKKASKDIEVARAAEESGREANRKLQDEIQRMVARAERAEAKIAPMERLAEKVATLTEEIKELKSRHQELLVDLKAKHTETIDRLERKTAKLGREKDELQKSLAEMKRTQTEVDRALAVAAKDKEKLERERDDLLKSVTDLKQTSVMLEKGHAVSLAAQAAYEQEIVQLKLATADKPGGDGTFSELNSALSTALKEMETMEREKQSLQKVNDAQAKTLADLQRRIAQAEEAAVAQRAAQVTAQRGYEAELARLRNAADGRIAQLTLALANLEKQMQRSDRKVDKLTRDKAGLVKSVEGVTSTLGTTKRDLELAKEEVQRAAARAERAEIVVAPFERLQAKLEHLSEEKSKTHELLLEAKRAHAFDTDRIQRLERENAELQRTIERTMGGIQDDKTKLEKENFELSKALKAAQEERVQAGKALNETETTLAAARKEGKKARERIKTLKRDLRQSSVEHEDLNRRYAQSEELLRAAADDLRHINGTLASSEFEVERARSAAGNVARELSELRVVYTEIVEALENAPERAAPSPGPDPVERLKKEFDESRGSTLEELGGLATNAKEIAGRIIDLIWQCDRSRSELAECQEQRDAALEEAEQIKTLYATTSAKSKTRVKTLVAENSKLSQQISEQLARLEKYEREREELHVKFQAHKAEHYHAVADINRRTVALTKGFERLAVSKNDALRKIDECQLQLRDSERDCARLQQLVTSLQEKQQETNKALQTANETSRDLVAELARARRQIALLRGDKAGPPAGQSANALKFLVAAANKDLQEAARIRTVRVPAV